MDESASPTGSEAAVDWTDWVPDPPPSPWDGMQPRFDVSVEVDGWTIDLDGYASREIWTSPEGRRVARFQYDLHEISLSASHSHSVFADVSIRQDLTGEQPSSRPFTIEVSVRYQPYQGKAIAFDWQGQRPLDGPQSLSGNGIGVVIVPRQK